MRGSSQGLAQRAGPVSISRTGARRRRMGVFTHCRSWGAEMTGCNRHQTVFARFGLYKELKAVAQCNMSLFQG